MAENGTTLAKAYVQIMPSAQGIKGNLAEALGGDAASVGQSWGQKLAGSIKGVITAAGIGAALGKTLTEGAALEQSIGGVETLFKGSADRVIAAADNAYRTAGVSANSYMEQVTSFSATLLQGLVHDGKCYHNMDGISGHAGLFANATTLAKLAQVMQNYNGYGTVRLADFEVNEYFTGRKDSLANWGMGWWRIRDMIDEELERRDTRQGARCDYLHGKAVRKFMT